LVTATIVISAGSLPAREAAAATLSYKLSNLALISNLAILF